MSENFQQLLEQYTEKSFPKIGQLLTAVVSEVQNDYVLVDMGLKSDSKIPIQEFKDAAGSADHIQSGVSVEVVLESFDNGFGLVLLSHEKARRKRIWDLIAIAMHEKKDIECQVTGKIKGGFSVSIDNVIRAFLPSSLVDARPIRDLNELVGQSIKVRVISMDEQRSNVVVSRKALLAETNSQEREKFLSQLEVGMTCRGIVKNITDYGAFVAFPGGVDGLLHITDISWKRVPHPSEVLSVGQELDVKILRYDQEKSRISLGLKQFSDDPWDTVFERHEIGSRHTCKVVKILDYGCFLDLGDGLHGLVHVSEMDWRNSNINPSKVVSVGQEVEVVVLELDKERRRISLSMKRCVQNPWEQFAANHNPGDIVDAKVSSITDFGVFVTLDGNIDGLVHANDAAWTRDALPFIRTLQKGDDLRLVLLSLNIEEERISLGLKQMEAISDAVPSFLEKNPPSTAVSGSVVALSNRDALVLLDEETKVQGLLSASNVTLSVLKEGDQVRCNVEDNHGMPFVTLSEVNARKDKESSMLSGIPSAPTANTIGDFIKEKI